MYLQNKIKIDSANFKEIHFTRSKSWLREKLF